METVYGLQFSDKTALTWGLIFKLREDTHMTLQQYSLLSVWFCESHRGSGDGAGD